MNNTVILLPVKIAWFNKVWRLTWTLTRKFIFFWLSASVINHLKCFLIYTHSMYTQILHFFHIVIELPLFFGARSPMFLSQLLQYSKTHALYSFEWSDIFTIFETTANTLVQITLFFKQHDATCPNSKLNSLRSRKQQTAQKPPGSSFKPFFRFDPHDNAPKTTAHHLQPTVCH